jgi:hypothetical protein
VTEDVELTVKRAIQDVINEKSVVYAQGVTAFADKATDAITALVDAWDDFMLRNLAEDAPEAAKSLIDARIAAIERSRASMGEKIDQLRRLAQGNP